MFNRIKIFRAIGICNIVVATGIVINCLINKKKSCK